MNINVRNLKKIFWGFLFLSFNIVFPKRHNLIEFADSCFKLPEHRFWINDFVADMEYSKNIKLAHKSIKNKQVVSYDDLQKLIVDCNKKFNDKYKKVLGNKTKRQDSSSFALFQKCKVPSGSKICIVGDIHGSGHSVLRILLDLKDKKFIDCDYKIKLKNFYFVFTGDYVERGLYGAEVWSLLLSLKLANWDNVFILRGNHENELQNENGYRDENGWLIGDEDYKDIVFRKELELKYGEKNASELLKNFYLLYQRLPLALFLESGKDRSRVQFCHGSLDKHNDLKKEALFEFFQSNRNFLIIENPEEKLFQDFFWGDFSSNKFGQIIVDTGRIDKSIKRASSDNMLVARLLEKYGLKAVFRGHQHYDDILKLFDKSGELKSYKKIISNSEKNDNKICISKYFPVFTFTTATEYCLANIAGYGILTTGNKYKEWNLELHEIGVKVTGDNLRKIGYFDLSSLSYHETGADDSGSSESSDSGVFF